MNMYVSFFRFGRYMNGGGVRLPSHHTPLSQKFVSYPHPPSRPRGLLLQLNVSSVKFPVVFFKGYNLILKDACIFRAELCIGSVFISKIWS